VRVRGRKLSWARHGASLARRAKVALSRSPVSPQAKEGTKRRARVASRSPTPIKPDWLDGDASARQTSLMTLLQQMEAERLQNRERLRLEMRRELRRALGELVPARKVIVFGSLTRRRRFSETSDIDVALESEPAGLGLYQLTSLLAERLGRRVDVVLLPECRFRDKILREGETWTLPD
jgi:predicted nucleotidyltransferase